MVTCIDLVLNLAHSEKHKNIHVRGFFLLIYLFVTINFVMSVTVNVCVFVMCVTV